jgi:acetoacetate decarboxylase
VHFEWIKMPDSSGFGTYTESGMVIPCRFRGEDVNFVAQMYLDDDPPISAGREIWGFPKKYAHQSWKSSRTR